MTACERAAALLPESWRGALPAPDSNWLAAHLAACSDCAADEAAWRALGALTVGEPAPGLRARLGAALAAPPARAAVWPRWRLPLAAAASVLLVALGLAAGWWWRGASLPAAPAAPDTSAQIASLRREVETTQRAVLSLLRQSSPSTRLQGVVDSTNVPSDDGAVRQALLEVLENDPNPNVRLAAIDALARPGADASGALVEAFHYQSSPLVQIALMDHLAGSGAAPARALMHTVSQSRAFVPEVRQRAAWALRQ